LEQTSFHKELKELLKALAKSGDVPHLIFYGPSGAGKKTRILGLLRELFGPGADRTKVELKTCKPTATSTPVDAQVLSSSFHVEVSPAEAGRKDVVVVQTLLKEVASSATIGNHAYKVCVLNDADMLSRQAQAALRRTMEKHVKTCRVFMCVESLSKVIAPLRSRCVCLRVPAPTVEEVCGVLQEVAAKEKLKLPDQLATNIAFQSNRNLRKALLLFEAARAQQYPLTPEQVLPIEPWEQSVRDIAKSICEEQTPKRLLIVRSKLYDLLGVCIEGPLILQALTKQLLLTCDDATVKRSTLHAAALYEHTMAQGSKEIFHLEAFVGRFMSVFKDYIVAKGV